MKKYPWMKLYTLDWLADPHLRLASFEEKGFLIDLMAYAHSGTPYGYLINGSQKITPKILARLYSVKVELIEKLLNSLQKKNRIKILKNGTIIIPRMVKDAEYIEQQSEHGKRRGNTDLQGDLKGDRKGYPEVEQNRTEQNRTEQSKGKPISWDIIINKWNKLAKEHSFPSIDKMNATRKKKYRLRRKEFPKFWKILKTEIPRFAPFVSEGNWFTFDWVVKSEENFTKIAEGNYRQTKNTEGATKEKKKIMRGGKKVNIANQGLY